MLANVTTDGTTAQMSYADWLKVQDRIAELEAALRPFAESYPAECADANGWTSTVHREAISTWFGPADFRTARAALKAS